MFQHFANGCLRLAGFGLVLATAISPCSAGTRNPVLYTFSGQSDGANPRVSLIEVKRNFYGTAFYGGDLADCPGGGPTGEPGCGVVFKLGADGTLTTLHAFTGGSDGGYPLANLIADVKGNLYGTTYLGGGANSGNVFAISPKGKLRVLHAFNGGIDGANPAAGVIEDDAGNFYGTTFFGGNAVGGVCNGGCGTVFRLAAGGTNTVLYSFCSQPGCADGANPGLGSLIADPANNLYGTTELGGGNGGCAPPDVGCGVVFMLAPNGGETVRHAFTGGSDGGFPQSGLIADPDGNLYGTTTYGGDVADCPASDSNPEPFPGCGVVYKIAPDGNETVLYTFTGGRDGGYPVGGLVADAAGNLYGTTTAGGSAENCPGGDGFAPGCGVVFMLAPGGSETVLYTFTGGSDGANPYASLFPEGGWLYGTAVFGGNFPPPPDCGVAGTTYGCGTIFRIKE